MIKVQHEDFDTGQELAALTDGRTDIGGVASFIGLVREMADDRQLSAMTLEHYPGMTEKMLGEVEAEARKRWPLDDCLIIHRYGRLEPGERIVMVAAASAHRKAALEACAFLIDWLKTKAPFWKLEESGRDDQEGGQWVRSKSSDDDAAARWSADPGDKNQNS